MNNNKAKIFQLLEKKLLETEVNVGDEVRTVDSCFEPEKAVVLHSQEHKDELEKLLSAIVKAKSHFQRGTSDRLILAAAAVALQRKIRMVGKQMNTKELLVEPESSNDSECMETTNSSTPSTPTPTPSNNS